MNLYLHYKSVVRNILYYSFLCYRNTYALLFFNKLQLYFSLRKITLLEDSSLYNYFYLIRFFFANKAYISNYKFFYSLRVNYYSFTINCNFYKTRAYLTLALILNDVMPFVNKRTIKKYFISTKALHVTLNDVSLFSEKKTNMGLYNLNERFNYEIYISNVNDDYDISVFYMQALKIL